MLYAKPSSVFWIYLPFQVTLQTDYKVSLVTCHGQTRCIWCKCQEEHSPSSEVWADSPPQLTFSNEDKEYWFQQQTLPEQLNPSCWTQWTQLGCSCSSHSSAGSSSCQGKGSNSHKRGTTHPEGLTIQIWPPPLPKLDHTGWKIFWGSVPCWKVQWEAASWKSSNNIS